MATQREPITCHVLDTTTGTPAAGVHVKLAHIPAAGPQHEASGGGPAASFAAVTNDDGRVTRWTPQGGDAAAATTTTTTTTTLAAFLAGRDEGRPTAWRLVFETGAHFAAKGVAAFFPAVDIVFVTGGPGQEGREHYHVPLLVGPFNYTTYRGS